MGNSLEGRDTLAGSRIHQRPHLGEQLRTPIRAKAMGDLAKNHAPAQCLFTGMMGRLRVDRLYECTFDQIRILT